MLIICILGRAGRGKDEKPIKSHYGKDASLTLPLKEGEFLNSTHCLFESAKLFESLENADYKTQNSAQAPENSASQKIAYKVITTQKALDFQRELFAECAPQSAAILKQAECAILKDDSEIDEIFQQILSTIEQADKGEQIVLDITHGFRHQPIIASFASVLGGINAQKSVQIVYAKAADSKNLAIANTDCKFSNTTNADSKNSAITNTDSNNADFTNTDGKFSNTTNADFTNAHANNTAAANAHTKNNAAANANTPKAHFCYVSLQKYAQISLISLALNSFLKTLTLPELPLNPKKALLRRLEELCAALHANAINSRILDEALSALAEAKKSQTFSGLDNILDKIEQLLGRMRRILSQPKECEKFRDFAEFMFEKGFYLIAATYISEGLGHFMLEKFKNAGLLKNANAELYDKIQAAKDLVYCLCTPNKQARKETKDCLKVEQARQKVTQTRKMGDFQRMKSAMADISSLRNALVHLSLKQQNVAAVRVKLLTILNTFKGFFLPNFLQGF